MKLFLRAALAAAAVLCCHATALAQSTAQAGEKTDSGLGELPPYSRWPDKFEARQAAAQSAPAALQVQAKPKAATMAVTKTEAQAAGPMRVLGESLDSGLGDLPHYRHWKDPTGADPLGLLAQRLALLPR